MVKNVDMNRLTGTAKTFDISVVEDGYIRIYGGMMAFGRKRDNKRRDEMSVSIDDVKKVLAEYEGQSND